MIEMSVTSEGYPSATTDAQRAVIDSLATSALALDREIRHLNDAEVAHHSVSRLLAEFAATALSQDPDFRLSDKARNALGGEFCEGPLLTAAVNLGLVSIRDKSYVETAHGAECDILARIKAAAS